MRFNLISFISLRLTIILLFKLINKLNSFKYIYNDFITLNKYLKLKY